MKELTLELTRMVANGVKKNELEESIGLPQNSLSAVLNGNKEMPASWIPKIQEFLSKPLAEADPEPEVEKSATMSVTPKGEISLAPTPESLKKLEEAIAGIRKDFGQGAIMTLGEKVAWDENCIPTGSLGINLALGIGGLPRGRIIEIFGPESAGKTTVALHIIAEAQKRGGACAFIDVEHAFDNYYAELIGVKVKDLKFSQPDYGEQALEEADRLISTGAFSVIVIDSVAALVPKSELEGEMGDTKMGLQARLMSQACRKLTATISKTNTICIFINQLRATIGQMYQQEVTTGGNALKFYASIRLDVRKIAQLKDGEEAIGNRVKVKVVKNKVAPPFRTAEFDIIFGEGISKMGELIDMAVELNIVKKSGAWYSYNDAKMGQGRESAKQMLKDHPAMAIEIEKLIKEQITTKE